MIGAFSFKGIPSSNFNLICQSISRPLLPALKSTLLNLPGNSGIYDAGINEYDLRTIQMRIQYQADETSGWPSGFYNLRSKARDLSVWLGAGEWGKLIISGEEDKYYIAKVEDIVDLQVAQTFGVADISFICQPFAYAIEDIIITGESPLSINYSGTRQINKTSPDGSKFDISFACDGIATFELNDRTLTYTDSGSYIIHNVEMEIEDGLFANLIGDIDQFLELRPGPNTLTYTGATDVEVIIRPMYY